MRLDKWLWAARFYKTRGLAQTAVAGGKVRLNDERAKPAKAIAPGDRLAIHIGEYEWLITVLALANNRGPADVARQLYEEDEMSRVRRTAQAADRRAHVAAFGERKGRPTKRERRQLERWRAEPGDEG
jgi:ribosome-associated heat shock protein Hsp15